ncbi:MAG: hypothetical protein R3F30_01260 [Planctomycetota bacterium]
MSTAREKVATPSNYRSWPGGEDLPDELDVLPIHGELQHRDYGLVADGFGFEDSPDCERISGGINSKGPDSVALGRQANWFLWGFCAPPDEMTGEARKLFVNVCCYMARFDGQRPLVTKVSRGRDWAWLYAGYLGREARLTEFVHKKFPAALLEGVGDDPAKLKRRLAEVRPWLRLEGDGGMFSVDEDARALGPANDDVALLDRCVALLEAVARARDGAGAAPSAEDLARARRVLARYTAQELDSAAEWRRWLEDNRERMFFSDVGGYRWFVAPKDLPRRALSRG